MHLWEGKSSALKIEIAHEANSFMKNILTIHILKI